MSAVVYQSRADVAKRIIWGAMILIGISLLGVLYSFKTMAQSARKDVRHLEVQIESEERNIQLLKADVAYLERPDRLVEFSQVTIVAEPLGYKSADMLMRVKAIPLREGKIEGAAP
ncbi:MAG: hypothetical protein ABJ275_06035 [Maricaulaceae bacterium]